ncbi:L,D-transpeptidase family protein [Rhizobium sp. BK251]|uniref:L,D-transpeptidase family protein n=1 Tax=Rhizobium sp. BK251 TaxID=2512125 RepID=UPI00104E9EEF|nr:L,D-transpeptidase family protein [Rhizobium sp. BK251]TCL70436.1 L,D-transpeptidase-like protein [Rhizobium sp. BK251]
MISRFLFGLGLLSATALMHPVLAADARKLQIVVSKSEQSVTVYDGTEVVAASKASTGKQGHSTPSGIFSVLEKEKYHESNIYSNSPMPYMQRLTWSGIALHESSFVPGYPASHGCVRLPKAFALQLYKMTKRGVPVIIADKAVAPEPVDHPSLFRPEAAQATLELLSDAVLRPSLPDKAGPPVQVAMNEPPKTQISASTTIVPRVQKEDAPIRILITRRGAQETVIHLQRMLNALGFSAGVTDGMLGRSTIQAINTFKQLRPLEFAGDRQLVSDKLIHAVYQAAGRGEPPNGILMVRQDFAPLFEAPVTITDPEVALGTHFYTVHSVDHEEGTAEWVGMTLEDRLSKAAMKRLGIRSYEKAVVSNVPVDVLDRISIPEETRRMVGDLLSSGSTLTITDSGLGTETGKGTDFITITRDGSG